MQIETESTSPTSTTLIITATQADMAQTRERVEKELTANVKIPGFRQGKAPSHLAAKEINTQSLYEAFLTRFVPQAARQALDSKNVRSVLSPEVSVTQFVPFENLEITVKTQHLGQIQLADYSQMSEKLPEIKVTEPEVQKILKRIQLDFATYKAVERVSRLEDRVWIDFTGFDKANQEVSGASGEDYPLLLGSQTFIPGFEEKLIGCKAAQDLEFTLRFPKNYTIRHLAGKEVLFKVRLKKVEKVTLPALDDDLVTKVGSFKSVTELKKFVKKQIADDKKRQAEAMLRGKIVAELAQKSVMEIPEGLIEMELNRLKNEHRHYLKENKLTLEQWLEDMGLKLEEHEKKLKQVALNRIKGGIVLREVAHKKQIKVGKSEIDQHLTKHGFSENSADAKQKLNLERDIEAQLLTQKALEALGASVIKKE